MSESVGMSRQMLLISNVAEPKRDYQHYTLHLSMPTDLF